MLYFTGVLSVLKAIMLKNKAVVLMYHRVLTEAERQQSFSNEAIVVGVESFANQIEFLKKTFNVISLDDFLDRLPGQKFEKYTCLITFDDGWIDNYANAYPVLKKNDLSAVIFLPVDFIDSKNEFWREKISAILFSLCNDSTEKSRRLLKTLGVDHLINQSSEQLKQGIQEYANELKKRPPAERALVVSQLTQRKDEIRYVPNKVDQFLSWEQVKEMRDGGVVFGSHSYYHTILTELNLDDVAWEVNSSRAVVHDNLGTYPRAFCYPNGDYSEQIVELVVSGGYEAAFTTRGGRVDAKDNPFTIKRMNISENVARNTPLFLARLLGLI